MKYREARLLKAGDQIIIKQSGEVHCVESIEVYGKELPIRINCGIGAYFYHTEVDGKEDEQDEENTITTK